jgi:hypothetical protein
MLQFVSKAVGSKRFNISSKQFNTKPQRHQRKHAETCCGFFYARRPHCGFHPAKSGHQRQSCNSPVNHTLDESVRQTCLSDLLFLADRRISAHEKCEKICIPPALFALISEIPFDLAFSYNRLVYPIRMFSLLC